MDQQEWEKCRKGISFDEDIFVIYLQESYQEFFHFHVNESLQSWDLGYSNLMEEKTKFLKSFVMENQQFTDIISQTSTREEEHEVLWLCEDLWAPICWFFFAAI